MSAVAIRFAADTYGAAKVSDGIAVRTIHHKATFTTETSALAWLGDHGLTRRQSRRLLDAALRGTGPFADPKHKRRVL